MTLEAGTHASIRRLAAALLVTAVAATASAQPPVAISGREPSAGWTTPR